MVGTAPLLLLVDAALRGALVMLSLFVAWRLVRDRRDAPAARVGAWLMACIAVQTVSASPALEYGPIAPWKALLVGVSVGNAVLFWIFVRALFDDEFVLRRRDLAAWLAVVALGVLFYAVVVLPQRRELAPFPLAVAIAMRWVPLLFAVLALAAAASQWRADLVERRRRLRVFIVGTGAAYTVITAIARIASRDGRLSEAMGSVDVAMLLGIAAVVAQSVLRVVGVHELLPVAPAAQPAPPDATPPPVPAPDPADERLAAELQRTMAEDRAYRDEDLTIAGLATRLSAPEYRLRRLINQRLGHRNFNAYVNGFRLEDAKRALADPAQREVPVLTIALEAGFQSIGPFNRAFKAATELTPTEFRRQHMADS